MVIGINTTSDAVFFAETSGGTDDFKVEKITKLQFALNNADDLSELFKTVKTLIADFRGQSCNTIAMLRCSKGLYSSSIEAIKAEGCIELAAHEHDFIIIPVAPQSLKSALGCQSKEKWQMKSKELFNAEGDHKYWAEGANGAAVAAYKAIKQ